MKKVSVFLLCIILVCLALPVSAVGVTQTYTLGTLDDGSLAFTIKEEPAFWENPQLKAGETISQIGTFTINNATNANQKIGLYTVQFPYNNDQALQYLNHLHITVKQGNTVLYDGQYSHINDKGALSMNCDLAPGSAVTYSITLRCDYTYTGGGWSTDDLIEWKFYSMMDNGDVVAAPTTNTALTQFLIACGIAGILIVGVIVYNRFFRPNR